MPKVGENDECLGAQSKLTTAGDTGENAVCPEAQSINKIHENCLRVPRGTAMGTGSPAIRALARPPRWTDYNLCDFLIFNCSMLQEDYEAALCKSSVRKAAMRASEMAWGPKSTHGTPSL